MTRRTWFVILFLLFGFVTSATFNSCKYDLEGREALGNGGIYSGIQSGKFVNISNGSCSYEGPAGHCSYLLVDKKGNISQFDQNGEIARDQIPPADVEFGPMQSPDMIVYSEESYLHESFFSERFGGGSSFHIEGYCNVYADTKSIDLTKYIEVFVYQIDNRVRAEVNFTEFTRWEVPALTSFDIEVDRFQEERKTTYSSTKFLLETYPDDEMGFLSVASGGLEFSGGVSCFFGSPPPDVPPPPGN